MRRTLLVHTSRTWIQGFCLGAGSEALLRGKSWPGCLSSQLPVKIAEGHLFFFYQGRVEGNKKNHIISKPRNVDPAGYVLKRHTGLHPELFIAYPFDVQRAESLQCGVLVPGRAALLRLLR